MSDCSNIVCGLIALCAVIALIFVIIKETRQNASTCVGGRKSHTPNAGRVQTSVYVDSQDELHKMGVKSYPVDPVEEEPVTITDSEKTKKEDDSSLKEDFNWNASSDDTDKFSALVKNLNNTNVLKKVGTPVYDSHTQSEQMANFSKNLGSQNTFVQLLSTCGGTKERATQSFGAPGSVFWGASEAHYQASENANNM